MFSKQWRRPTPLADGIICTANALKLKCRVTDSVYQFKLKRSHTLLSTLLIVAKKPWKNVKNK